MTDIERELAELRKELDWCISALTRPDCGGTGIIKFDHDVTVFAVKSNPPFREYTSITEAQCHCRQRGE